MRFTHSIPSTEETLVTSDLRRPQGTVFKRFVAEKDGQAIAYAKCEQYPMDSPVRFVLAVAVEPEQRNEGLGAKLYKLAETVAVEGRAEQMWVQTAEGDRVSEQFAERRGYKKNFFIQDLKIDLAAYDSTPFEGFVREAEESGIRFVPYSHFEDSEENRRKLYELNATVERDVPNVGRDGFASFETWQRRTMEASWYDAEGQILAIDGDRWVGIGAVGKFSSDLCLNTITGVLREYRGRKLGVALKVLGIEYAKRVGAREIHTQNHGTNQAMLAINARIGYKQEPGWNFWERVIEQPSHVE